MRQDSQHPAKGLGEIICIAQIAGRLQKRGGGNRVAHENISEVSQLHLQRREEKRDDQKEQEGAVRGRGRRTAQ